jgi:hypothetical protein
MANMYSECLALIERDFRKANFRVADISGFVGSNADKVVLKLTVWTHPRGASAVYALKDYIETEVGSDALSYEVSSVERTSDFKGDHWVFSFIGKRC